MATNSNILAWKVPWTEESGGLQNGVIKSQTRLSNRAQHDTYSYPTYTYTRTLDPGSERTAAAILGVSPLGSWNPGSWRPASCLLLKLYLKPGGGLVAKMCPTLVTSWMVAFQASLSMGFSRQEYWSWLPFPSPGDLPDPRIEPGSPAFQADSLPTWLPDNTYCVIFKSHHKSNVLCIRSFVLSLSSAQTSLPPEMFWPTPLSSLKVKSLSRV